MESILKSDIFFFIASIAVVLFTAIFVIFGFYLIKIMKNFFDISSKLKDTTYKASNKISKMGDKINKSRLFTFIFGKENKKRSK